MDRLNAALASRYRLERKVGQGGMATVYLAADLQNRRQVAIKVLDRDLAATIGAQRFLREIEIAARLTHPHILPIYDSGEADGFLYYVMPFVDGESLRSRLDRESALRVEDAVTIAREIADALDHAHRGGLIHRDIKPENILLQAGHAVLADFGIARAVCEAGTERITATGVAIGTPSYMAPEQAAGERVQDSRVDIYALGCVVYEMLAGEPPFLGATAWTITARKLSGPVPSLRVLRTTLPRAVERVVRKALARTPADRYATAPEFTSALDAALRAPTAPATLAALSSLLRGLRRDVAAGFDMLTIGWIRAFTRHRHRSLAKAAVDGEGGEGA